MWTRIGQVLSTQSGQLTPSLIVLDDQASPNQEWFSHLGDGAGWQTKHRCDDIQAASPVTQNCQILLLHRPQSKLIDLLQFTGILEMLGE